MQTTVETDVLASPQDSTAKRGGPDRRRARWIAAAVGLAAAVGAAVGLTHTAGSGAKPRPPVTSTSVKPVVAPVLTDPSAGTDGWSSVDG